ncbi:thioesterase II family protein [Paludibacterium paludis]|uniref:Thioesterase n=1 Tax=Paludibacterium paludis TaxID=1225769 RepID=A0A918P407_9NEIS|nr:alpha/beta fold hydrolase [Paludibacterium paludis]GGY18506.1 thioesterase [Paludibacterium paludis]
MSDVFAIPSPKPAPVRLYCLPCAGGSAEMYRGWDALLPDWLGLWPLELPGRGKRFGEPLLNDATVLAGHLLDEVLNADDRPFALFGHSMGALLAYEMACQMEERGKPERLALVTLSGREPPHLSPEAGRQRHALPEAAFLDEVRRYGGLPAELEQSRELLQVFMPVLRNDFALVDGYRFGREACLASPLFVVGGDDEPDFTPDELEQWQGYSRRWQGTASFPGGHFYFNDGPARTALMSALRRQIAHRCEDLLAW